MAFFQNRTVNLLNLHYGIFAVVMNGGGAFICVYLLHAGVPLPAVLLTMAAITLARFIIRPVVVRLAVRFGLRPMAVAGTVLMAAQYPIIAEVHGIGLALMAVVVASAVADTVYWSCYHAYFAALGDAEHRGHQTSMREAIAAVVGIVAPLLIGWMLATLGARAAFGASGAIMVAAAGPLLWTPQVKVANEAPGAWRAALPGVRLFIADGWIQSGFVFLWQIALFMSLKGNFLHYGGTLAFAALAGAVAGLFLGRHIDAGHGGRAVVLAMVPFALVVLLRAVSPGHPELAVFAAAFSSVGSCLYMPVMMTAVYNQAKAAPCTLRFHVACEGGWDIGCTSGCVVTAALIWLGVPISGALLLPLAGVAASFVLLRDYFAATGPLDLIAAESAGGNPPSGI
jgi:MFS family permease